MEILFVVDSEVDLDKKIALLEQTFDAKFKFFVDSKLAIKVMSNKFVMSNLVSIYSGDINTSIEKYVKSNTYTPTNTLIYYSSANIDKPLLENMLYNIRRQPNIVYVKKKLSWWDKVKLWFYSIVLKLLFGVNDEYASLKLQYISSDLMKGVVNTKFSNRIFSVDNARRIELSSDKIKSHYYTLGLKKYHFWNACAVCLILITYVILEAFFKLKFWMYLLIVILILSVIINEIIMMAKEAFDNRFKK